MALNKDSFLEVLRKFADSPEDVTDRCEEVLCQIRGELISVTLYDDGNTLYCKEGSGEKMTANAWIVRRIAKLDQLANSILRQIDDDPHFISVPSKYLPVEGNDLGENCERTADAIFEQLKGKSPFQTSAIYLLSEAGDGKTMVMNRLARLVAAAYRDGKCDFVFLPISLEGRPFLRIDDLVIGILANKFRFREFYYEAVVELIKMGALVLGLDGFEEIIVEGREGPVISSLTELLKRLESKGSVVISARKAFYDYATHKQIGLLDALRRYDVFYPAYRLSQWKQTQFCSEMETFGFSSGEATEAYQSLVAELGADHPVLVRPVLARRFVEMMFEDKVTNTDSFGLMATMSNKSSPQEVLDKFVGVLVEREARNKWYVTSGPEKGLSLMSIDDHYSLFELLSEEMWNMSMDIVPGDFLQEWTGLFCELKDLNPARTSDCKVKILQHALLLEEDGKYSFCHDEFRKYFFGRLIAKYILEDKDQYRLSRILENKILDAQVIESAVYYLLETAGRNNDNVNGIVGKLLLIKDGIARNTTVSQNIGVMILRVLGKLPEHDFMTLQDLHVSECAIADRNPRNIKFKDCQFERLQMLHGQPMKNVAFVNCNITAVVLDEACRFEDVSMDEESIPTRLEIRDSEIFNPDKVKSFLLKSGVSVGGRGDGDCEYEDEQLEALMKITRMFYRATAVTSKTLRIKFGSTWSKCDSEYLPMFIKDRVLIPVKWSGGGVDERFKLGLSLTAMQAAYQGCDGKYKEFLRLCRLYDLNASKIY